MNGRTIEKEQPPTLVEAVADLEKANAEFGLAHDRLREASSGETAARNRLNQAQRKVDDAVIALKKAAPRDTDWRERESFPVPVSE